MASCDVCDIDIDDRTTTPDAGYGSEEYPPAQTEYDGEIYRFCSVAHKETFESEPERFVDEHKTGDEHAE